MKKTIENPADEGRRRFLSTVVAAGAVTAASAVIANGDEMELEGSSPAPSGASAGEGYRETEHIRRYYRTARL